MINLSFSKMKIVAKNLNKETKLCGFSINTISFYYEKFCWNENSWIKTIQYDSYI